MDISLITPASLRLKRSHKNIMIQAVSVVCSVSQRFFYFFLCLFSFYPQKVWDNYESQKKKEDLLSEQINNISVGWTPRSLSSPQMQQKRRGVTQLSPRGPIRLSTQLLSVLARLWRLLVLCYLMWVFEAAMWPRLKGSACCLQLCPVLPEDGRFKARQSWTFSCLCI